MTQDETREIVERVLLEHRGGWYARYAISGSDWLIDISEPPNHEHMLQVATIEVRPDKSVKCKLSGWDKESTIRAVDLQLKAQRFCEMLREALK